MDTDTFFQILDRLIIARLKEFHFGKDGNSDAARMAGDLAEDLGMAGRVLLWEYARGRKAPRTVPHMRFHDHAKVEGRFGPHSAEMPEPTTVFECVATLAQVHADYWQHQGRAQTLKKLIKDGGPDVAHFEKEFASTQRRLDMDNQIRNVTIVLGDQLLAEALKPRPAVAA